MLRPDIHNYKPIHRAVVDNNADEVVRLLARRAEMHLRADDGQTPLHLAVTLGRARIVHILLGHGADPNERDHHGRTVLHAAAIIGAHELAGDLLSTKQADVDASDLTGATPLHLAAACGHVETLRVLLDGGAQVNVVDQHSLTPLHYAVDANQCEAIDLLIARKAMVTAGDRFARTPLHLAARGGFREAAAHLLVGGAEVNERDKFGQIPLHEAAQRGHLAVAELLLRRGAQMNAKDQLNRTPFMVAVANNQAEMAAFLRRISLHTAKTDAPAAPQPEPAPVAQGDHGCLAIYQKLEQQSRLFEAILNAIPDYVFMLDRQQRFTFANQPTARALGIPAADFAGKHWKALSLRSEAMLPLLDLCQTVYDARLPYHREFPWLTVEGVRRVHCTATPLIGADGEVTAVVCVARDITQTSRSEEARTLAGM